MPKMKKHSGMSKRVKITGTGKLLTERTGIRHYLEVKSSKKVRSLSGTREVSKADLPRVKKLLGR
jgi:large subunit ribosomal protein L35